MKIFLSLVLVLGILLADHDYEKGADMEFHMPRDLSFLDLNSSQEKKIYKTLSVNSKKLDRLHKKEEKLEKKARELFLKKRFDKEKFLNIMIRNKKESLKIEADMLESIHDILTPKQREKFSYYLKEWEND